MQSRADKLLIWLCSRVTKRLLRKLPENRFGDRLYHFCSFVRQHQRLPDKNLFNDKLYKILTTSEVNDPLRVFVSDKEYVKFYIKALVGEQYNVPTLKILRSESDVDSFSAEQDCVLKPTHSSGKCLYHHMGESIDRLKLKSWLKHNYYLKHRQANYKTLTPKIIVEPMLRIPERIVDYKVFCVDGEPRMIKVDFDRHTGHLRKFYDTEWNPLPFSWNSPPTDKAAPKPQNLQLVLDIAAQLSRRFNFIRVDFYIVDDRVYVGELTNCDGGSKNIFYPKEAEEWATRLCFDPNS